jgi:hypothetical protein
MLADPFDPEVERIAATAWSPAAKAILVQESCVVCTPTHRAPPQQKGSGGYVSDSAITAKVKTAIFNEPSLSVSDINVETKLPGRHDEGSRGRPRRERRDVRQERHAAEVTGLLRRPGGVHFPHGKLKWKPILAMGGVGLTRVLAIPLPIIEMIAPAGARKKNGPERGCRAGPDTAGARTAGEGAYEHLQASCVTARIRSVR